MKSRGCSIKIFLTDGTAGGLRIVEKSNWTGRALACSRVQLPQFKSREEFDKPGIYALIGTDEESEISKIYIGEGDPTLPRLESHLRSKDFWTHLVLFTSKDQNLNKAHIQYLESRLVGLANSAKRYQVENGNAPTLPAISEADSDEMEQFLEEMLVLYSVLGINAFDIPVVSNQLSSPKLIIRTGDGIVATGYEQAEGFLVEADSRATLSEVPSCPSKVKDFRKRLVEQGIIVVADKSFRFTQNYVFSSPSMSAAIILGRSSNGRIEWKNERGTTLRDIQEAS